MIVYSKEYVLESKDNAGQWDDNGVQFCLMLEEFANTNPSFPHVFKGGDLAMTDSETRFRAVKKTLSSVPCWRRTDISGTKCDGQHIDETSDGKFRVHMC